MRYLDAVALAQLKHLRLTLPRHRAESRLSGRHRGSHFGFSQEFAHHRPYAPGDELKFLDWKVYARKERFFVRQFQEDVALRTTVVVDRSGSMAYRGTGAESKWEHACRLAAAMACLVMAEGDAAGLVTFDTEQRDFLAPSQLTTHLELIDRALAAKGPGGETDLSRALSQAALMASRRSLIMLISDLIGEPAAVLATVRAMRARKHEVFVLQVLDPAERDLPMEGPVLFESLEDARTLRCDAGLVRRAYREAFDERQRLYDSGLRQAGVAHAALYTDRAWDANLREFLARQRIVG